MIRDVFSGDDLLAKASSIGQYYGFSPLSEISSGKRCAASGATLGADVSFNDDQTANTVVSFLKQCGKNGYNPLQKQPLFVWHANTSPGRPAQKRIVVQFHALGTDSAVASVVVIRALLSLVRDLFRSEPILRINSMGDKETRARYARELSSFFKKRAGILREEHLTAARRDVIEAAELLIAAAETAGNESDEKGLADELPSTMESLSDASRRHFENLLEYLELTETPYELTRTLIARSSAWNDLCFEIVVRDKRAAWGSQYSALSKQLFPESHFPGIGAVLYVAGDGTCVKKLRKPRLRVSFVHISHEAKRLSIKLAEDLRRARIPIAQHIGIESLSDQLALTERDGSEYLLVMGRKEALENCAVLRNRHTQEEIPIPLDGIVERLKALA